MNLDLANAEWEAWQEVVQLLTDTTITALDWKASPIATPKTKGEAAIQAIILWGEQLVALRTRPLQEACEEILRAAPMQQGERNGYIMGIISLAIDKAAEASKA